MANADQACKLVCPSKQPKSNTTTLTEKSERPWDQTHSPYSKAVNQRMAKEVFPNLRISFAIGYSGSLFVIGFRRLSPRQREIEGRTRS